MSRSRKDESRFHSGSGLQQGSPCRDNHSASGYQSSISPSAGGHNCIRSKGKDLHRSGNMAKDKRNPGENRDQYFAQGKQRNFQSPPSVNFSVGDVAAPTQELSWADEVEMSMPNSGLQRLDKNVASTVAEKTVIPLELSGVKSKGTVEAAEVLQVTSDQLNMECKTGKVVPRQSDLPRSAACSNGKARQDFVKDPEPTSSKRVNCPPLRRGSRKKTLSLNPEEREALENLIEEVIMDGVVDSDSASSEDDAEHSDVWKKNAGSEAPNSASGETVKSRNDKGKMGRKYYPGQLKVALKHMTELPPRFSRKLKKAEKYLELNTMRSSTMATTSIEEEDEESVALAREEKRMSVSPRPTEREKDKTKSKEHHVKEFKRSIRTLLTDLDQYVDEKSVPSSSMTSIHPPGAIICEELERESLSGQPTQSTERVCEVPSTVQSMMMAAGMSCDQAGPSLDLYQEHYEEQYRDGSETGSLLTTKPFSEPVSDVYSRQYYNPTGYVQQQEIVSLPDYQQVQQYSSPHLSDHSLMGMVSNGGGEAVSGHGLMQEEMASMGQVSPHMCTGSVSSEHMSSGMMDYSGAVALMPPALTTSLTDSMSEQMVSAMSPAFVTSSVQLPVSALSSHGTLPYYQFQNHSPMPQISYGFSMQAPPPHSSSQYCFMPPALPPHSLPPPFYPRDVQVQHSDGMQYKALMQPEWGYTKPKTYSNSSSALPAGSTAYSNYGGSMHQYPVGEHNLPGPGVGHYNMRQRRKQPGSSVSPRTVGNSPSSVAMAGKFGSEKRGRASENMPATARTSHYPGDGSGVNSYHYPEPGGMSGMLQFGDSASKRPSFSSRNRGMNDVQMGYPGRRDNRNYASDKYAVQRNFANDGKKEPRHVTLKPKQVKTNKGSARTRNDSNSSQGYPIKAHHLSDLSEEGIESPDNYGDVESGADDYSTDNYDQEVSKKMTAEETKGNPRDIATVTPHEDRLVSAVGPQPSEAVDIKMMAEYEKENFQDVIDQVFCSASPCSKELINGLEEEIAGQDESTFSETLDKPSENISEILQEDESPRLAVTSVQLDDGCLTMDEGHVTESCDVERDSKAVENIKRTTERRRVILPFADLDANRITFSEETNILSPEEVVLPANANLSLEAHQVNSVSADSSSVPQVPGGAVSAKDVAKLSCESASSAVDMDCLHEAAVGKEKLEVNDIVSSSQCEANCESMDVILSSSLIKQMRKIFDKESAGSVDKSQPTVVRLSMAVMNQVYQAYLTQSVCKNSLDNESHSESLLEADDLEGEAAALLHQPEHITSSDLNAVMGVRISDDSTFHPVDQLRYDDCSDHPDSFEDADPKATDVIVRDDVIGQAAATADEL